MKKEAVVEDDLDTKHMTVTPQTQVRLQGSVCS